MSSPTSAMRGPATRRAERAALRARLARPVAALLALAIVVLAGLFVYQMNMVTGPGEPTTDTAKAITPPDEITVRQSTVTGFDKDKQPYSVTAQSAVQDRDKPNLIKLRTVSGETHRSNGDVITIAAREGIYDSDTRIFDLAGDVQIGMPGRFMAQMEKAAVTVADKVLKSGVPVTVTMNRSTITSNGLEISNDGKRIMFFNGVKARFLPSGSKGDTAP
jgi:lipopolysaccharide export system protein LptC